MTFDDLYTNTSNGSYSQNFLLGNIPAFISAKYCNIRLKRLNYDTIEWEEIINAREDFAGFMMLFKQARPMPKHHSRYDGDDFTIPLAPKIQKVINDICNNPQE